LEKNLPALFSPAADRLRAAADLAAIIRPSPRTLALFPVTPPGPIQYQIGLQAVLIAETDPNAQLAEPLFASEFQALVRGTQAIGEWIVDHPWLSLSCFGLLVLLAGQSSKN
jgi:hypothetical protein